MKENKFEGFLLLFMCLIYPFYSIKVRQHFFADLKNNMNKGEDTR